MMNMLSTCLALFSLPGGMEWIVIAIIGLLIFGKRLPEVGKSLGRSIVEFKKGLRGVEDDIDKAVEGDQTTMLPPPDEEKNNKHPSGKDASSQTDSTTEDPVSQNNSSNGSS